MRIEDRRKAYLKTEVKMKVRSYRLILVLLVPLIIIGIISIAGAQEKYPSKPITVLVGYSAGGATDGIARGISEAVKKILGVPVVVTNKPGAGTAIAMEALKNAKPDGYTICCATTAGLSQATLGNAKYDFFDDFTHICNLTAWLIGFSVSSSSPWKTFQEFQAYAKAHPGEIKFGATGIGSTAHLSVENLLFKAGIKAVQVPTNSDPEIVAAVMGGHLQGAATSMWGMGNFVKADKIRPLVLITEKRVPAYPDTPTPVELGLKLGTVGPVTVGPVSIVGPKGLSKDVVKTLAEAFKRGTEDSMFRDLLKMNDHEVVYKGPEEAVKLWREYEEWSVDIMKRIGMLK